MMVMVPVVAIVLAGCSRSAEQYYSDGLDLHQQGRFEDAIREYDEVIRLEPHRIEAYNNRGRAYLNLDQAQEAIADFDQVLRLDPQLAEAYYNRGLANSNLGQAERANADFAQAIGLDPQLKAFIVGDLFHRRDNLEEAIDALDSVIRLNPGFADDYLTRGNLYRFLGQPDRAIQDFDEAIRLNPELAEAYYGRALAYTLKGEDAKAQNDVDRAVELGTDSTILKGAIKKLKGQR